ncbi:hypothetical protein ACWDOP_14315 [Nocardia sp. NPDC003693]
MITTATAGRRFGWATKVSLLATALAFAAAPTASAEATFTISGQHTTYYVGKTYNLNAPIGTTYIYETPTVNFYDNGRCVGSTYVVPTGDQFPRFTRMAWVPTTPGTHTLRAQSGFITKELVVTIEAAPADSTPDPQPEEDPCVSFGSSDYLRTGSM